MCTVFGSDEFREPKIATYAFRHDHLTMSLVMAFCQPHQGDHNNFWIIMTNYHHYQITSVMIIMIITVNHFLRADDSSAALQMLLPC